MIKSPENERLIALTPKQLQLKSLIDDNRYSWIGYGGARGGAKSHAIRNLALYYGLQPQYQLKSMIFRRYSKELLKNHILPLFAEHPRLMKNFNKSEKILYDNNHTPIIQFGYADTDSDIHTFQGAEYDLIFIDEATHCTEHQIRFLRTSNRTTKPDFRPKMVLTMNPGGVSHALVKRLFIDKSYRDNEDPNDYAFIQSHVWDNVFWVLKELINQGYTIDDYYSKWTDNMRRDFCISYSDYAKNLKTLPDDLAKAYLFGDWEIFGGMFFKNFNKNLEVIAPFEIPTDWKLIGSIDPGFSSPCSFGITAVDYAGNHYRVLTYYEKEKSPHEHADSIQNLLNNPDSTCFKLLQGRKPNQIISGRDAFAKKDRYAIISHEKTFADIFAERGMFLTPAVTDRKQGWWAWKSLMPSQYFIFEGLNEPLLAELLAVVSDNQDPEDIKGKGNHPEVLDHALDEQKYAIMSLFRPKEKVAAAGAKRLRGFEDSDDVLF